jgi:hypothetical protein
MGLITKALRDGANALFNGRFWQATGGDLVAVHLIAADEDNLVGVAHPLEVRARALETLLAATLTVSGPLTDAQLAARALATVAGQTSMLAALTSIDGHVDGLEGLAAALNGFVDGLETLGAAQATSAKQDALAALIGTDAALTTAWAAATSRDTTTYGSALVDVNGLSGGDVITVQGTLTGAAPLRTLAVRSLADVNGALVASITADGLYVAPAAPNLQYAKTGSASTPTVTLTLKR